MTKKDYPGLFLRVKSTIYDTILMIVIMVIISNIFSTFEHVPDYARMLTFILIFGLYDPIMISAFGGTVGHKLNFIKVQNEKKNTNISFLSALIRYLIKTSLGWISLLTISTRDDRKAIHDTVVNSIVVFEKKRNANTV